MGVGAILAFAPISGSDSSSVNTRNVLPCLHTMDAPCWRGVLIGYDALALSVLDAVERCSRWLPAAAATAEAVVEVHRGLGSFMKGERETSCLSCGTKRETKLGAKA